MKSLNCLSKSRCILSVGVFGVGAKDKPFLSILCIAGVISLVLRLCIPMVVRISVSGLGLKNDPV